MNKSLLRSQDSVVMLVSMDAILEIQSFVEAQKRNSGPYGSERKLSLALGSQSTIQQWRYGLSRPWFETARRLADIMGDAGWWEGRPESDESFVNALLKLPRRSRTSSAQPAKAASG